MSAQADGYIHNLNYVHNYDNALNPIRAKLMLLQQGLATPTVKNACELGFGQGVSLNAHAAGGRAQWYGTDFNPSHVASAQYWSGISGSGALIADQSFKEFCQRDDLPEFEFIGLHGVWSWISDENRRIIVDFIRRKLAVGGIVYISYNTLPGWAAYSPIRHLLSMHYHSMSSSKQSPQQNILDALAFGSRVLKQSDRLQQHSPQIVNRIENLTEHETEYLAHEYLNKDWQPMYFAEMAKWLEDAKISFACSSSYFNDFQDCLYNEEQESLMSEFAQTPMEQTVKDFILNTQFRKDLWVKGTRRLTPEQLFQARSALRFALLRKREDINFDIRNKKTVSLKPEIFDPILNILADYQIHSFAQLHKQLKDKMNDTQLMSALVLLHAKDDIALIQDEETVETARPRCKALNRAVLTEARHSTATHRLVSPYTGEALTFSSPELWFISAYEQKGLKEPEQWAKFALAILKEQNKVMQKEGKPLEGDKENLAELTRLAKILHNRLDGLRTIGILDNK